MTEQPMQGGYRRPENPAPVSGPGSLSRRTDGQGARYMSGGEYGEGQEMMDLQNSAPMSKTETVRPRSARSSSNAIRPMNESESVTPLFSPTSRPNEPITAGAAFGPGAGPSQNVAYPTSRISKIFQKLSASDDTGDMEYIANLLIDRGL